jgi:hypothetical protein
MIIERAIRNVLQGIPIDHNMGLSSLGLEFVSHAPIFNLSTSNLAVRVRLNF